MKMSREEKIATLLKRAYGLCDHEGRYRYIAHYSYDGGGQLVLQDTFSLLSGDGGLYNFEYSKVDVEGCELLLTEIGTELKFRVTVLTALDCASLIDLDSIK